MGNIQINSNKDSLKKRYAIKYICTFAVVVVNAAVQLILPRALGIDGFADYTYNLNVFTSILSIAILSMDGAFASKVSKRLEEVGLIRFYAKFLFFVIAVLNLAVWLILFTDFSGKLFSEQTVGTVLLALNASLSIKIVQEFISLYDCYALTRISDPILVAERIGIGIFVYLLYFFATLELNAFYVIQILAGIIVGVVLCWLFYKKNRQLFIVGLDKGRYASEFYAYCRPLVLVGITGNLIIILSNYILKNYGGNAEQAYYGVAWQINSLIVYTFTPITALLQREYSVRINDRKNLKNFYKKSLLITMVIVCYFSCFVIVNSKSILQILFGDTYAKASIVTIVIMIYTIFQAWGQVNANMFFSSERTSLNAKINFVMQIMSVGLLFVFQVPNFIWPEGLGSVGIGLQKMTGNIISVMVCTYFNCKYLGLKYIEEMASPVGLGVLFSVVAISCRFLVGLLNTLIAAEMHQIVYFVINGVLYSLCVIMFAFSFMKKMGIDMQEVLDGFRKKRHE